MLTDWAVPGNFNHFKDDSLVKLASKKARAQAMMQNNSKKRKFAIETSFNETSPNVDEYVTTTSIKKGGYTYKIAVDCIGRTREVNRFVRSRCVNLQSVNFI